MRKTFRDLHLWLSVPFGIIITLTCLSGALLVFEKEVERAVRLELYRAESHGRQPLPVDSLMYLASAALPPGQYATGITIPRAKDEAWRVGVSTSRRSALYIDPYTGRVTGRYERLPFFAWTARLHRWLLDSRPKGPGIFWGKIIVGTSTLLFVVILITGVVLWWPRTVRALKSSLSIPIRKGWQRGMYALHVAGGMYALLFLLILALTGLTWSFNWYRTGFYRLFGVTSVRSMGHGNMASAAFASSKARSHQKGGNTLQTTADFRQWQTIYRTLADKQPDFRQISIAPGQASVSHHRYGNTRAVDRYRFDPSTGQIKQEILYKELPTSGRIRGCIYSVHVGSWGGLFTRILTFGAALLGATLALTGYYLWFKRLRRKKHPATKSAG